MTERRDPDDARVLAVYRRVPAPEPSPALDAAIRAAARQALERAPRRWLLPTLASAAVLVLAVGLGLRLSGPVTSWRAGVETPPGAGRSELAEEAALPSAPTAREQRSDGLPPAQLLQPTLTSSDPDRGPPPAPGRAGLAGAGEQAVDEAARAAGDMGAACPPPLPPGLAGNPDAIRRRVAELAAAGRTAEAECLARALEGVLPRPSR